MTALHRLPAPTAPTSTPALLLSLSHALEDQGCPLARQARRLARRLARGDRARSLTDAAAFCMAALLENLDTDPAGDWNDEALLDVDFDA